MEPSPDPGAQTTKSGSQFTILSILVITGVFAALSLSLGYLYRAVINEQEMGYFIIYTAFSPLLVLFMANLIYQTVRWFQGSRSSSADD